MGVAADPVAAAWRGEWGGLLAVLVRQFRHLDLAEEALAEAFARASARWPVDGPPERPAAWLLSTARRAALDVIKHEGVVARKLPLIAIQAEAGPVGPGTEPTGSDGWSGPSDDRLRLLFLCCHPALAPGTQLDEAVPHDPMVSALLALMLLQHSRRDARFVGGRLVELAAQDRTRWHHDEIAGALGLLMTVPPGGDFAEELRLQALIASRHAVAATAEATEWSVIADLYGELDKLTGSPIVRLNRAVAVAEADGPRAGLALLDGLEQRLSGHHRLPAVRAELLRRTGDRPAAAAAYRTAIERCANAVERDHLVRRLAALE